MYVGDLLCKEVLGRDRTNLKEASDYEGFPGGANGNESACQGWRLKRCRFDLWVKKIPWRMDGIAIHSSILVPRIPWREEPGELQSTVKKSWT